MAHELDVVHRAEVVRSRAAQQQLQTHAIRVCVQCGSVMGQPRTEAEYESTVDVCSSECWQHVKRGG